MKLADLFNSCANKLEKAHHPAYNNGQKSATQVRYKAERFYETAIECLAAAKWDVAQQWQNVDVKDKISNIV